MNFLENKYTKCYFRIIEKRRKVEPEGYSERHHIIPKSLGGNNKKDNIVRLTAREHLVCHLLLTKMTTGNDRRKMVAAVNATAYVRRFQDVRLSGRTFQKLRAELADQKRGIPRSEETRKKISKSKKGKLLSAETKLAISIGVNKHFAENPVSDEVREKIGKAHRGKIVSEQARKNIGNSSKGRKSQSKTWVLRSPTGEEFTTNRIEDFCIERGLSVIAIRRSYNLTPVYKGASKGWLAIFRSR